MKTLIRFICCIAVAVVFAGCHEDIIDNEKGKPTDDPSTGNGNYLAEGYFRATFFPQQGGNIITRAESDTGVRQPQGDEVRGYSTAIQTLQCYIYQEQKESGDYLLIAKKDILKYNQYGLNNELWPLEEVSFDLKNGNYKAVFVGNTSIDLFQKR